jgi:hypothetical protein
MSSIKILGMRRAMLDLVQFSRTANGEKRSQSCSDRTSCAQAPATEGDQDGPGYPEKGARPDREIGLKSSKLILGAGGVPPRFADFFFGL